MGTLLELDEYMQSSGYLERVLGIICSVFDAYSVVLFLPSENPGKYVLSAKFSLGDSVEPGAEVAEGECLVGWIMRNNQPMLINNFDQQKSMLGYYSDGQESQIKAFLGCPLPGGQGALCLDSKRTYSFSDKDQKILDLFAQLIQDLNARMEQAGDVRRELAFYRTMGVMQGLHKEFTRWPVFLDQFLKLLSEATGFSHCFFAAKQADGEFFHLEGTSRSFDLDEEDKTQPIGAGLVGWVFKNNTPVFSSDEDPGRAALPLLGKRVRTTQLKSVICLPVTFMKTVRGVLGLAGEESVVVNDQARNFATIAADHLALFLENLYLKSTLRKPGAPSGDRDEQ